MILALVVLYLVVTYVIPALELWWHNTVLSFEAFVSSLFHLVIIVLILLAIFVFVWFIFSSASRSKGH